MAKPSEKHGHGGEKTSAGSDNTHVERTITPRDEERITHDLTDIAKQIIDEHRDEAPPTPEEMRRVRWKIDLYLLPLLVWIYALQFLDKVSYGQTANFGALVDLELEERTANGGTDLTRFRDGSMIFWCGYLAGIYPLTLLAQRMKPSRSCSAYTTCWGVVFILGAVCSSWQGIFAQRFVLGFLESGVTPCFMTLTAMFYTKAEQASRSAIWFAGTGVSQVIGYPMMYGVLKLDMDFPKWKAIYLLWGSMTLFFGVLFFFIVPNDQASAFFLKPRQRYVAVERLRSNQAVVENIHFQWYQAREALTDPRCLLMIPLAFLNVIPNACVSTFTPIVLRGMGYTPLRTIIMTIPSGCCNVAIVVIYGFLQQRFRNTRFFFFQLSLIPIIACSVMLWKLPTDNLSGRFFAVTWFSTFTSSFVTLLSLTVSNVSGHTKRSVANAMFLMGYGVGQVAGPLTYKPTESPNFPSGFLATTICLVLDVILMCIYTALCYFENRRRDRMGDIAKKDRAFQDLTDKENLSFRYEL